MARETFRWQDTVYDIDQIRTDINSGKLRPEQVELTEAFISNYNDLYLVQRDNIERPPIHIDIEHAQNISPSRIEEPIFILYVGQRLGLISLNEQVQDNNFVVADGNHRIISANSTGSSLTAYILSPSQSSSYASDI